MTIDEVKELYATIAFMEKEGFVPVVQQLATWDEIPINQLRIPVPRTHEIYYLRVIDGIIEAVYAKNQVMWKPK